MTVVRGLEAFPRPVKPVGLALGTFDGLHRGHRALLDAVLDDARRADGQAVVVTFDPHPVLIIAPPVEPFLLTTLDERIALFETTGIDVVVVARFDETVRHMTAQAWLDHLVRYLGPRSVFASPTHAFGRNREGTPDLLQAWGAEQGVNVTIIPPLRNGDVIISSSAIRAALRGGDVRTAADWLGRWYAVRGQVVVGDRRGRQIGVPTANLRCPAGKLIPARGVYAAYATVGGATHGAAVNIGVRPTFGAGAPSVEAHLLDVEIDLYGQTMDLAFVGRIRDEVRFPGVEALKVQLASDIAQARVMLADSGEYAPS
jgi:riboflavin kinase/FMN adenylyltransferase